MQLLCQLLGDTTTIMDRPLLCQLFLQRIPPTVHMVLTSSTDTDNLEEVVQLTDKIMEAAPPTMAALTPAPLPYNEVKTLH